MRLVIRTSPDAVGLARWCLFSKWALPVGTFSDNLESEQGNPRLCLCEAFRSQDFITRHRLAREQVQRCLPHIPGHR